MRNEIKAETEFVDFENQLYISISINGDSFTARIDQPFEPAKVVVALHGIADWIDSTIIKEAENVS